MARYLLDSNSLTLDDFCTRSHSRQWKPGAQGKFRDVIDAFRTVYWLHGLRMRISAKCLHGMERRLEPEAFRISEDGVRYRHNKWRGYHLGRHTPLDSFVAEIDLRCEGSRMEFDHVLWDVLRLQHPVAHHAGEWVQRLEPTVQVLVWNRPTKLTTAGRIRRRRLDKRTFEMLERRAGLDALACLTLLLREAHEAGESEYAFELGYWLCRMLLLTGFDLRCHGIAAPLYEFYDTVILPLGSHRDLYRTYSADIDFLELTQRLTHALCHIKGINVWRLTPEQTRHYQQKILGWGYGWDYFELFKPMEISTDPQLASDLIYQRYRTAQNMLRQWALNACLLPSHERIPPPELLREVNFARSALERYQRTGRCEQKPMSIGTRLRVVADR